MSRPHREKADQRKGHKSTDERAGRHRQETRAKTQKRDSDGAGGGAGGNAENIGIGKRVAQKRLQHRPGERQRSPAAGGDNGAAEAITPDNALIQRLQRITRMEDTVGDSFRHDVKRNGGLADGRSSHQRDEQQGERGESQSHPAEMDGKTVHLARPAAEIASASVSMPSMVRMVGFIACASISNT
ncbi:hypothetical protein D3C78_816490 [compost metagenome]